MCEFCRKEFMAYIRSIDKSLGRIADILENITIEIEEEESDKEDVETIIGGKENV